MPIEIRELLIKAEVTGSSGSDARSGNGRNGSADRDEIIEESVRRVLEILQKKEER